MTAFRVLVLCTGNSARSQIAEALLTTRGGERVEAQSAGSVPVSQVNPLAVEVLRAHGIQWDGRVPRSVEDVWGQHFNLVITVCDDARDACPFFPNASAQVHWGLPDPAHVTPAARARDAFAETYTALSVRVDALLALPLEAMSDDDLSREAQAVHDALI
jgi:arsenate reductase